MELTERQIDAIKRLNKTLSMRDGSADECHEYYCPYNIGCVPGEPDDDGNIYVDGVGVYHGKPDGFDSECPRFFPVNRETGDYKCLCALEVVAMVLGVDYKELYKYLLTYFGTNEDILGYNPRWRKEVV